MREFREGGLDISKIHQLSGRIFARMLKKHGISDVNPAQGRILFVLWEQDGIPIVELSRRTQLGKSTLTAMLDRLEEEGWLKRESAGNDRRKILIWRTEMNKILQETYKLVSGEMLDIFYAGFSENEIDAFEAALKRVLSNLEASGC